MNTHPLRGHFRILINCRYALKTQSKLKALQVNRKKNKNLKGCQTPRTLNTGKVKEASTSDDRNLETDPHTSVDDSIEIDSKGHVRQSEHQVPDVATEIVYSC